MLKERSIGCPRQSVPLRMRMTLGTLHHVGRFAFLAKHRVPASALKAMTAGNRPVQHHRVPQLFT